MEPQHDPEANSVFRRRVVLPPFDAVPQKQILRLRLSFSQVTLWLCGDMPFTAELCCTTDKDLPAKCQRRQPLICVGSTNSYPKAEG